MRLGEPLRRLRRFRCFSAPDHPSHPLSLQWLHLNFTRLVGELTPNQLANVGWAFAILDDDPSGHFAPESQFWSRLEPAVHTMKSEDLTQVHLVGLWCTERGLGTPMAEGEMRVCADAKRHSKVRDSRTELQVWRALCEPFEATHGHVIPEGYSVDVLLNYEGHDVLVEFDGPNHFLGSTTTAAGEPRPNGATALKRRLLRSMGYWLVSVPYWEWDAVRLESTAAQRTYLIGKMIAALKGRGR